METQKIKIGLLILAGLVLLNVNLFAQDSNFYIYLCFGQSNMQGQGPIETQDRTVNSRFKTLQALDCSNLNRKKDKWYTAVPPTCQCYSLLSPADYFGRTMVANLPDSITVGIINVSIAGCDIRLFDKDIYMDYDSTYTDSWFTSLVAAYDWNPYQYLVNLAKLAQQDGVIKGILLHQGETNTGDTKWPSYVKKIYNDMLTDLSLSADSVPLLAGEVLSATGNCCSYMNTIIDKLPQTIPTAHVISSSGCPGQDAAHFNSAGYRKFGRRYAVQMLSLLGYEADYAEIECGTVGINLHILADNSASNAAYVTAVGNISAPTDDANIIKMDVSVNADTNYYIYGRFKNPSATHNSIWLKVDDGEFELYDSLTTNGWEWRELKNLTLSAGKHTISLAFAEDSVMIDKIGVKNSEIKPVDVGEEAAKLCTPQITGITTDVNIVERYSLGQNYPNPFNPTTTINYSIPKQSHVILKIYDVLGKEVKVLVNRELIAGKYSAEFDGKDLTSGIYFYQLQAGDFTETKKLILLK